MKRLALVLLILLAAFLVVAAPSLANTANDNRDAAASHIPCQGLHEARGIARGSATGSGHGNAGTTPAADNLKENDDELCHGL